MQDSDNKETKDVKINQEIIDKELEKRSNGAKPVGVLILEEENVGK